MHTEPEQWTADGESVVKRHACLSTHRRWRTVVCILERGGQRDSDGCMRTQAASGGKDVPDRYACRAIAKNPRQ
jgi:hypothetical protein